MSMFSMSCSTSGPADADYRIYRRVDDGDPYGAHQDVNVPMLAKYEVVGDGYHIELEIPLSGLGVWLSDTF